MLIVNDDNAEMYKEEISPCIGMSTVIHSKYSYIL